MTAIMPDPVYVLARAARVSTAVSTAVVNGLWSTRAAPSSLAASR